MSSIGTSELAMPPWRRMKSASQRPRLGAKGWLETSPTNRAAMADEPPQRGEIWIVEFGPSVGGEIQKIRPAIILSNDTTNGLLNRVQVVPISSRAERLYPSEAYVTVSGERRKAMVDQMTTVSKLRLLRRLTRLPDEDLVAVGRVACLHLGL
jgi:mRNA interferase MazF